MLNVACNKSRTIFFSRIIEDAIIFIGHRNIAGVRFYLFSKFLYCVDDIGLAFCIIRAGFPSGERIDDIITLVSMTTFFTALFAYLVELQQLFRLFRPTTCLKFHLLTLVLALSLALLSLGQL